MKYKVGDKVRVRSDLEVGKNYGFVKGMQEYLGKEATIIFKNKYIYYLDIDENIFNWNDEMLEPIETTLEDVKDMPLDKALEKLHKEGKTIEVVEKEIKYDRLNRLTLADLDTYNDLVMWNGNVFKYSLYRTWALTTLKERIEEGLYKCRVAKRPFVYCNWLNKETITDNHTGNRKQMNQIILLDAMHQWSNYFDNSYEFVDGKQNFYIHYRNRNYIIGYYYGRNDLTTQYFSSEVKAKECIEFLKEMELI